MANFEVALARHLDDFWVLIKGIRTDFRKDWSFIEAGVYQTCTQSDFNASLLESLFIPPLSNQAIQPLISTSA